MKREERDWISNFIKENKLSKSIILCGFESDKRRIYSNVDALIDSSLAQGISNSIFNNTIINNMGHNLKLYHSSSNEIYNNTFSGATYGVLISDNTTSTNLINNNIHGTSNGIRITDTLGYNNITKKSRRQQEALLSSLFFPF